MSGDKLRASKSGIGYAVEKKMEENYDREEETGTPTHIVNWLNGVLQGEGDPCPGTDWKSINTHLRDGVVLCKLINKLLKDAGKSQVTFQKKVMSPFVAMTNIENFNKGCMEYGMREEQTFQSGDLWELRKGPFLNVINTLSSLGFQANANKHLPAYTGEISKFIDRE